MISRDAQHAVEAVTQKRRDVCKREGGARAVVRPKCCCDYASLCDRDAVGWIGGIGAKGKSGTGGAANKN